MDLLRRRSALLALLRGGCRVTRTLASELGVSVRTVRRDLARLRREGFAVVARIGRRGGVWLDREGPVEIRLTCAQVREVVGALLAGANQGGLVVGVSPTPLVERLLGAVPVAREASLRTLFQDASAPRRVRGPSAAALDAIEHALHDRTLLQVAASVRHPEVRLGIPGPPRLGPGGWTLPLLAHAISWNPRTDAWREDLERVGFRGIPQQPCPVPFVHVHRATVRSPTFMSSRVRECRWGESTSASGVSTDVPRRPP